MNGISLKHTIVVTLLCAFQFVSIAQNKLKIIDCELGYAISNVLLLDSNGSVIARSDSLGEVKNLLIANKKITLFKTGYKTTIFQFVKSDSMICLPKLSYHLSEVRVSDKDPDYVEILREFIKKAQWNMNNGLQEVYYRLEYEATIRESHLTFGATAIMKIQLNSYSKRHYTMVNGWKFCSLDYEADSAIWEMEKLESMMITGPLLFIWHDPMRKGGYLNSLPKKKLDVRIENGNGLDFLILDSKDSKTRVHFNHDSTIQSYYQNKMSANHLYYEDTVSYNGMQGSYFSYIMHKSARETDLGIVDYQISFKSIEGNLYENSQCTIPYGVTFKPTEHMKEHDIGLKIK